MISTRCHGFLVIKATPFTVYFEGLLVLVEPYVETIWHRLVVQFFVIDGVKMTLSQLSFGIYKKLPSSSMYPLFSPDIESSISKWKFQSIHVTLLGQFPLHCDFSSLS